MLGPFFGKKLSFWPFLDFFTKQIKKSHKISNDGAQNRHQIYYKHLAIISSLGMKKCWDLFLAKNLASTSFYYLDSIPPIPPVPPIPPIPPIPDPPLPYL